MANQTEQHQTKVTGMKDSNDMALDETHEESVENIMEESDDLELDVEQELQMRELRERNRVSITEKPWNRTATADPMLGPGVQKMSPGAMQMSAVVKLHSRLAINLFRGRKGDPANNVRPIIGLARFARQSALVWTAAGSDDPYADQTLIAVEIAYEAAQKTVEYKINAMQSLLDGLEDFDITVQASETPVSIDLKFFSPWGFRGATLLKQFDKLVRLALTARHIGVFTDDDWSRVIHEASQSIRHMFAQVDSWISTGVKRTDLLTNNRIAQRAKSRYKSARKNPFTFEPEVLAGNYRAKLSPKNKALEAGSSEAEKKMMETAKAAAGKVASGAVKVTRKATVNVTQEAGEKKPAFGFMKSGAAKTINRDKGEE